MTDPRIQQPPLALPPLTPARGDVSHLLDRVHHCDLFTLCAALPAQSIDMILADLPYGTTACSWDTVIPFEPMWAQFKRVIKPRGAIVLTASQPFTSALVMSNPAWFRYEWIWEKTIASGFLSAKYRPLREHENILVFSDGSSIGGANGGTPHRYYPQLEKGIPYSTNPKAAPTGIYNKHYRVPTNNKGTRYPRTIIKFNNQRGDHPTQKPVDLFSYLIRTYTQPGDVILDPVVGSGTTALAAKLTQRHYVVGDISAEYVAIAQSRLSDLPRDKPAGDMVQRALFTEAS